ncbi:MAG: tetratricopeptide repeat protein [Pyrinomonadaceae bacterium]
MHKNTIIFVILAAFLGLVGGFLLANSINRSELNAVLSQPDRIAATNVNASQPPEDSQLTDAEIRGKIAEADLNPTNYLFQKDLGISLYRYAAMKQDVSLLGEAVRILERANAANNKDFDVLVALGNAHFDIAFFKKDASTFQKARDVYGKALSERPNDPDVLTDRGLTYFLQEPPELEKAAAELQKVVATNPRHERSLQFLVQTLVKQNKIAEAEKAFDSLKAINPNNSAIREITPMIAAAKSGDNN